MISFAARAMASSADTILAVGIDDAPHYTYGPISQSINRSCGITIGRDKRFNSYLSPLLHEGLMLEGYAETTRHKLRRPHFSTYSLSRTHASMMQAVNRGTAYTFSEKFTFAWLLRRHSRLSQNRCIQFGPAIATEIGADLILKNQNNPVFARANVYPLQLMVRPHLATHIGRLGVFLSDRFTVSLMDVTFTPDYTQLYYDIEANTPDLSKNVSFVPIGGFIHFTNIFAIDLEFAHRELRIGLLTERSKMHVCNIEQRNLNVALMLGVTITSYRFSSR